MYSQIRCGPVKIVSGQLDKDEPVKIEMYSQIRDGPVKIVSGQSDKRWASKDSKWTVR